MLLVNLQLLLLLLQISCQAAEYKRNPSIVHSLLAPVWEREGENYSFVCIKKDPHGGGGGDLGLGYMVAAAAWPKLLGSSEEQP